MNYRLLRTSLVIAGTMVMLSGMTTATRTSADPLQPPSDPEAAAIPVPEANRVFLIVHAVGTQTYTCTGARSEEHTSELQSLRHLVCRLLLEKKKRIRKSIE